MMAARLNKLLKKNKETTNGMEAKVDALKKYIAASAKGVVDGANKMDKDLVGCAYRPCRHNTYPQRHVGTFFFKKNKFYDWNF